MPAIMARTAAYRLSARTFPAEQSACHRRELLRISRDEKTMFASACGNDLASRQVPASTSRIGLGRYNAGRLQHPYASVLFRNPLITLFRAPYAAKSANIETAHLPYQPVVIEQSAPLIGIIRRCDVCQLRATHSVGHRTAAWL
ncbi:hypothetical protein AS156_06680 [Bradyrhizobium macuxiense]|uniref:Uncharacterized protein n=1 Tax=Bradyrhizobium macuxiense TaxID=1755647 RepID=A0A109JTM3_9BRAD|nr:hypothetical protein AS156_06680 [Bradyrhizobium macuxiense]